MANYTYKFRSDGFPNTLIKMPEFQDADDDMAEYLETINLLRNQGKYTEAAAYIEGNRELLQPYIFDSRVINQIIEEIRNTQIKCVNQSQSIFFSADEPEAAIMGDAWIGTVEPIWG